MLPVEVRRASVADAPAIASVHVQAWQETYANHAPREALEGLDVSARAARWAELIRGGSTDVYVADIAGTIVGWASASQGRDTDAPAERELEGIYVLARVYGTGVGGELLDAAIGSGPAYLWVLDGNARAEAFYVKHGFARDGTRRDRLLLGSPVSVVRLVR